MGKRELLREVTKKLEEKKIVMSPTRVEAVLDAFFDTIFKTLAKEGKVKTPYLIANMSKKERVVYNPIKKEKVKKIVTTISVHFPRRIKNMLKEIQDGNAGKDQMNVELKPKKTK